jgi:hypothetical protein
MHRDDLPELHSIQPIANLHSIAEFGILCHTLAAELDHVDVSDVTVQDRRTGKEIPHGSGPARKLHDYATVYVCGRNPMMYVRQHRHTELVVLRVSCDVLDLEGALVADGNASSDYTRFRGAPTGLAAIDAAITFLGNPTHSNYYEFLDRKRRQCAEVLVPERIAPEYISGVYASCTQAETTILSLGLTWPVTIEPNMFFQR